MSNTHKHTSKSKLLKDVIILTSSKCLSRLNNGHLPSMGVSEVKFTVFKYFGKVSTSFRILYLDYVAH